MSLSALTLCALICYQLAGHPVLIVSQLATICGPVFGLIVLARLFAPRPRWRHTP